MADVLPQVDPNVAIPPAVKQAGEAADAIHKMMYPDSSPPSEQVGADQQPVDHPKDQREQQPPGQPEGDPEQQPAGEGTSAVDAQRRPPTPTIPETGEQGSWEHRYLGMKGRYEQAQQAVGHLQEQMAELGDELQRTQQALQLARQGQQPRPQQRKGPPPTITPQDVETYGPELVDFVTRAARGAVEPDLQQVTQQVRQTSQQVQQTAQQRMEADLDARLPVWREINVSPRFKQWVGLRDVYSNEVRRKLINDAAKAADAPRVAAFFRAFLEEEQATGQMPASQALPADTPPPRQPAIQLESLASPGRAKPAAGNGYASAADKPVFTRAQVKQFYSNEGRMAYIGREADRQRDEQELFAAQREGRVR